VGHRVKSLGAAQQDINSRAAALEPLKCDASARSDAHAGTVLLVSRARPRRKDVHLVAAQMAHKQFTTHEVVWPAKIASEVRAVGQLRLSRTRRRVGCTDRSTIAINVQTVPREVMNIFMVEQCHHRGGRRANVLPHILTSRDMFSAASLRSSGKSRQLEMQGR
jgi:hypothetical protein